MDIAKAQGVDVQSDYTQGNSDFSTAADRTQKANAQQWKLTSYDNLTITPNSGHDLAGLRSRAALADGKPSRDRAKPVYQNFYSVSTANNGLYSTVSGSNMGYHAVTALGYDATGLRIENQWGTGWGDARLGDARLGVRQQVRRRGARRRRDWSIPTRSRSSSPTRSSPASSIAAPR